MKPENKPLSPLMLRVQSIRARLPDKTLLAVKLGDFYEFFFEDALEASRVLALTVTKRGDTAMSGIPYHAKDRYFLKLLSAGWKIAVADYSSSDPEVEWNPEA